MKGNWDGFNKIGSTANHGGYTNGIDYNTANSSDVGKVDSINTTSNEHSKPKSSTPNSVIKNYKSGYLDSERYYGNDGKAYLDIDYSNHGNSKMHPHVPHQHKITFKNGKMIREKSDGRIK